MDPNVQPQMHPYAYYSSGDEGPVEYAESYGHAQIQPQYAIQAQSKFALPLFYS